MRDFHFSETASRRCSEDGLWLDIEGNEHDIGWTNFTSCFDPRIWELIEQEGNKTGILYINIKGSMNNNSNNDHDI